MIYYNKIIIIKLNKNVIKAALLIYKNLYIKNLSENYSSIVLNSKNEMNLVYSALQGISSYCIDVP